MEINIWFHIFKISTIFVKCWIRVIGGGYRYVEIAPCEQTFDNLMIWKFGTLSTFIFKCPQYVIDKERLLILSSHHTADLYLAIAMHLITTFALGSWHNGFFSRQRPCLEWDKWLHIRIYAAEGKRPLYCRQHFQLISFQENPYIFIKIALKFVQKDPIDNKAALVQVMAWHQATAWTNP